MNQPPRQLRITKERRLPYLIFLIPLLVVLVPWMLALTLKHKYDIWRVCKRKCACVDCKLEQCMVEETRRREKMASKGCADAVEELTECEAEHGECGGNFRPGDKPSYGPSGVCGQLVPRVYGCAEPGDPYGPDLPDYARPAPSAEAPGAKAPAAR